MSRLKREQRKEVMSPGPYDKDLNSNAPIDGSGLDASSVDLTAYSKDALYEQLSPGLFDLAFNEIFFESIEGTFPNFLHAAYQISSEERAQLLSDPFSESSVQMMEKYSSQSALESQLAMHTFLRALVIVDYLETLKQAKLAKSDLVSSNADSPCIINFDEQQAFYEAFMLLQFEPSTWEKSDSQIFESAIETAKKIATNTEQTELSPDLLAISRIAGISLIHDLKIMRIEKDYVRKEAFLRNNVMNPAFVTNILRIVPGHCVRGELLPSGMVIYLHSEDFERFRKTKTSIVGNDEGQGELWLS